MKEMSFFRFMEDKKRVLLLTHKKMDGDGLSAVLILQKYFEQQGKEVTFFALSPVPDMYKFLPGSDKVENTVSSSQDVIISLSCQDAEVDHLRYMIEGNSLNIIITPKKGIFDLEKITTKKALSSYDAIVVLDTGDLEHLGQFYEENTDLFFRVPVINIDHHISNTGYGTLNFVDVTASSTTHILYQLFLEEEKFQKFLTPEIATLFLTGLIVDTGSFQHTNTSPKALEFAADLLERGAKQQEIIQNVYKTKQLSTLKLWGRVLSRIEEDRVLKIVWSSVTKEDLAETGTTLDDAAGIIDELMTNAPGAEIVVLFKDAEESVLSVSLRSKSFAVDVLPIAQHFGGGGHKQAAGFSKKGHNFMRFIADGISFIEQYQMSRLGLSLEEIEELRMREEYAQTMMKKKTEEKHLQYKKEKRDILAEIAQEKNAQNTNMNITRAKEKQQKPVFEKPKQDLKKTEKKEEKQESNSKNTKVEHSSKPMMKKPQENTISQNSPKPQEKSQENSQEKSQANSQEKNRISPQKSVSQNQGGDFQEKPQAKPQEKSQEKPQAKPQENPQVNPQENLKENPQEKKIISSQKKVLPNQEEKPQEKPQEKAQEKAQEKSQTESAKTPPALSKEQALEYAKQYALHLQNMDRNSPQYAQYYEYYQYYYTLGNAEK
jgi:phosphoesterase RecJ-like protein